MNFHAWKSVRMETSLKWIKDGEPVFMRKYRWFSGIESYKLHCELTWQSAYAIPSPPPVETTMGHAFPGKRDRLNFYLKRTWSCKIKIMSSATYS